MSTRVTGPKSASLARVMKDKPAVPPVLREILPLAERICSARLDLYPSTDRLDLADYARGVSLSRNVAASPGWDGTPYSYGLRFRARDTPEYDRPLTARGIGHDFGALERLARTSPQWQRVQENCDNLLMASRLEYDEAPRSAKQWPAAAEMQCEAVQRALECLPGGLRGYMRETTQCLLYAGWSLHVVVDSLDGSIARLEPRRPSTVRRWLLNDDETELLGVEFQDRWGGLHVVPIEHCLITSWRPYGTDLEGVPPIRTAAPYIVAKQLLLQAWVARGKKYAMPIIGVEAGEVSDTSDDERLVSIWDSFTFEDYPVFTTKRGQKVNVYDLGTGSTGLEEAIRYCDEQVLLPLAADSALVGLTSLGARNVAEVKEGAELAQSLAILQRAVDTINGTEPRQWTGLVKRLVDNTTGAFLPHDYPTVRLAAGEDEVPLDDILKVLDSGYLSLTNEIREHLATRLRLPIPPAEEAAAPPPEGSLSGIQISALQGIAGEVKAGILDRDVAIAIVMKGFGASQEEAERMVGMAGAAPAPTPEVPS